MSKAKINRGIRAARRLKGKKGQSLVEYALILSFISVLTVALSSVLGHQIKELLITIVNALAAASAGF